MNDNTARLILTATRANANRLHLEQRAEMERKAKQAYEVTGKPEGLQKLFPGLKLKLPNK